MSKFSIAHEDFQELSIIAALNQLSEIDRNFVTEYAATDLELEAELASLQNTVAALAYSVEPLTLPTHLKDRLFQRINSEHPCEQPVEPQVKQTPKANLLSFGLRGEDVNWEPHPDVVGVTVAMLHVDVANRQLSALVRCEPGIAYPDHEHAQSEEIFMLEGDLSMDGKVYGVGDFIYSATGSIHAPKSTNGCMFLVRTSLDDRFV